MPSSPMTDKNNNMKRTRDEDDEEDAEFAAARMPPVVRRQNAFDYGVIGSDNYNTDWDWEFVTGVINELRVEDAEDEKNAPQYRPIRFTLPANDAESIA